jgi:hypothetical protein
MVISFVPGFRKIAFCQWICTDPTQLGQLRDFLSLNGFVKKATGQWPLQWRAARSLPAANGDTLVLRPKIAQPRQNFACGRLVHPNVGDGI